MGTGWEVIKEFYQDKFGIDGWVIEMYANLDILILCASGASNRTIESFLEIPLDEIKKVIQDVFGFGGWGEDLPINPYKMFCSYNGIISSVEHFKDFLAYLDSEISKFPSLEEFRTVKGEQLFYLCETMYDIERKIQDEWI